MPTPPTLQRERGERPGQQQFPPGARARQQQIPPGVRGGQQPYLPGAGARQQQIPPGVRGGQQPYLPGAGARQQQYPPGARPGQQPYQSQPFARRAAPPPLEGWRPPARGPERDRAGQRWRQQHQHWDQYAAWRQRPDWWRNDSGFRLFTGLRMGFFFVPEMGYIVLPYEYRDRHWDVGDYLPSWFWRYTVRDYARYGLPRPPEGCVWVWLNGDIALIDLSDGYILDIARNVW